MKFFLHIEKKIAIKTDRFDKFAKYCQKWMQIFEDKALLGFCYSNVILKC